MKPLLAILLSSLCLAAHGATYYVATTGSDGAAGTMAAPISLNRALGDGLTSPAGPGDTIYLRGGTYLTTSGSLGNQFQSFLAGTIISPINVQPYGTEHPVIQAVATNHICLFIYGSNTWYRGIEFWNSATDRGIRSEGLHISSPGVKIVNCVIHDTGIGMYVSEDSSGAEITGNVVYNYGQTNTVAGQTHAIYSHSSGTGTIIRDNVTANGFCYGIHCFSDGAGQLNNIQIIGNTCVESGSLQGSGQRYPNILLGGGITVTNGLVYQNAGYFSCCYVDNLTLGENYHNNGDARVISNYFGRGTSTINQWTNLTLTANSWIGISTFWNYNPISSPGAYTWDGNNYLCAYSPFQINGGGLLSFSAWKTATGFDSSSTLTIGSPYGTKTFVRTNLYEIGRSTVTIYNWDLADNVNVSLSSACTPGHAYLVRNAQNILGASVKTFAYTGAAVSFPMTNLPPATPVGVTAPSATGPEFNVFVITETPSLVAPANVRVGKIMSR